MTLHKHICISPLLSIYLEKNMARRIQAPQCSLRLCLQQPRRGSKCSKRLLTEEWIKKMWYIYINTM